MTKEEIKSTYSMRQIVERYGLNPNRAGFIHCPFHKGDHDASIKIYKDSYHCFGCGANGDIFTFIQRMDNCDFKTAFYSLGGTYEKPTFQSKLSVYRLKKQEEQRKKEEIKLKRKKELNNMLIDIYRDWMKKSEPFSDVWCDCSNALTKQLYIHEVLNEKR